MLYGPIILIASFVPAYQLINIRFGCIKIHDWCLHTTPPTGTLAILTTLQAHIVDIHNCIYIIVNHVVVLTFNLLHVFLSIL